VTRTVFIARYRVAIRDSTVHLLLRRRVHPSLHARSARLRYVSAPWTIRLNEAGPSIEAAENTFSIGRPGPNLLLRFFNSLRRSSAAYRPALVGCRVGMSHRRRRDSKRLARSPSEAPKHGRLCANGGWRMSKVPTHPTGISPWPARSEGPPSFGPLRG
jgi:hypothetical protein